MARNGCLGGLVKLVQKLIKHWKVLAINSKICGLGGDDWKNILTILGENSYPNA
jgi:hypothetical protein